MITAGVKRRAFSAIMEREAKPHRSPLVSSEDKYSGFTLIELAVAMVIILVSLLGVFFAITFAIKYNSGNESRAKCLAVLQQEIERMRSAKFTPSVTDTVLQGGTTTRTVTSGGLTYSIDTTVDNDPFTDGIQDETTFTSLKEIMITARLANPSPGWQMAVPATVILRRVKSN
jgi:prepilin-type N-terminal cleavage/methylation domain-containing protein